ncbi:hypothetical protein PRIPAC_74421 [Pristionchus pacificus]|uniref:Uncharacterized protein n=1 Tax=Pristionchus pacificus TaxID=54126 RepID=A0A2A6C8Q9_PRIPA|nr:hypothetical protein PRIPAC_74421 [Pristionchus pacificus]|eukprot:PDM74564.1 hypothetical protein PRIPAC_41920 [Pristionchus pacificus]
MGPRACNSNSYTGVTGTHISDPHYLTLTNHYSKALISRVIAHAPINAPELFPPNWFALISRVIAHAPINAPELFPPNWFGGSVGSVLGQPTPQPTMFNAKREGGDDAGSDADE